MTRILQPELLDGLAANDPRALRSRRDLRRLNACMGNPATLARVLRRHWLDRPPATITDLGAGDGTMLLRVLRRMSRHGWRPNGAPQGCAMLVDRQATAPPTNDYLDLGWRVEVITADLSDWCRQSPPQRAAPMMANLVLHHFPTKALAELFEAISTRVEMFVALEPRRSPLAHLFSRCVGLIGCGPVTRYDAPVSVKAGFVDHELSRLWPTSERWALTEQRAGLFGHLFVARRANIER